MDDIWQGSEYVSKSMSKYMYVYRTRLGFFLEIKEAYMIKQTSWLGLRTQPRCKVTGNTPVKNWYNAVINIGRDGLSSW